MTDIEALRADYDALHDTVMEHEEHISVLVDIISGLNLDADAKKALDEVIARLYSSQPSSHLNNK